jgi:hypothetical protein
MDHSSGQVSVIPADGSLAASRGRFLQAQARAHHACELSQVVLRRSEELKKALDSSRRADRQMSARWRAGGTAMLQQVVAERDNLKAALASRDLIWTAKVIMAAGTGYGPDQVHQLLVEQSQYENRKLRDVAERIVTSWSERRATGDQVHAARYDALEPPRRGAGARGVAARQRPPTTGPSTIAG